MRLEVEDSAEYCNHIKNVDVGENEVIVNPQAGSAQNRVFVFG